MSQDLFQVASRKKFRFESPKGAISTEDLWDLPLTSNTGRANLDEIAQGLYKAVRASAETTSFVTPTTAASAAAAELSDKLEIVKAVITVRIAERDAASAAQARKEERQKILELIAEKKEGQLANLSLEDLEARLASIA
jgi:hypothetical protein